MAGTVKALATVSGISADTVTALPESGAHRNTLFYVDVTTITGTWTLTVRWKSASGALINLGTLATVTTTGMKELVLQSPFTGANRATPAPNDWLCDNTAAGSLTATLYVAYGD